MVTIFVANDNRPVYSTRRIGTPYFALQECINKKYVILHHVPGALNQVDSLTKSLAWILHSRRANTLMG